MLYEVDKDSMLEQFVLTDRGLLQVPHSVKLRLHCREVFAIQNTLHVQVSLLQKEGLFVFCEHLKLNTFLTDV